MKMPDHLARRPRIHEGGHYSLEGTLFTGEHYSLRQKVRSAASEDVANALSSTTFNVTLVLAGRRDSMAAKKRRLMPVSYE